MMPEATEDAGKTRAPYPQCENSSKDPPCAGRTLPDEKGLAMARTCQLSNLFLC